MIPLFAGQQPDMEVVANGDLRDSEPDSQKNEASFAGELVGEGLKQKSEATFAIREPRFSNSESCFALWLWRVMQVSNNENGFAKLRTSFANGKMQSKQYEWSNGASGTSGVHDALAYKVVKVTSDVRVEGADMM